MDSNRNNVDTDDASVATTILATEVGSVVGRPKDAFLRSITFLKPQQTKARGTTAATTTTQTPAPTAASAAHVIEEEEDDDDDDEQQDAGDGDIAAPPPVLEISTGAGQGAAAYLKHQGSTCSAASSRGDHSSSTTPQLELEWTMDLEDAPLGKRNKPNKNGTVMVQSIGGVIQYSLIEPGDYVKLVNGQKIGPSYNAQRCQELMQQSYQKEGYLSVQVGNPMGQDSLVQATILKPRPDMTYGELGMIVWFWGVLCIKSIDKTSIWAKTVLKETDHIISINDILCDKMREDGFAHIIKELPNEITIVVRRGKQRWFGGFN